MVALWGCCGVVVLYVTGLEGWVGIGGVYSVLWVKNGGPKSRKNGPRVWAFCKIEFPGIQKPVQILTQKSAFFKKCGNRGVGVIWWVGPLIWLGVYWWVGYVVVLCGLCGYLCRVLVFVVVVILT